MNTQDEIGGHRATREPEQPVDWPLGHVLVEAPPDSTESTGSIRVVIHGVHHCLRPTTAAALMYELGLVLQAWEAQLDPEGRAQVGWDPAWIESRVGHEYSARGMLPVAQSEEVREAGKGSP